MKPHKHAEVIKAWADGYPIQFKPYPSAQWRDWQLEFANPGWHTDYEYRVKPHPEENQP